MLPDDLKMAIRQDLQRNTVPFPDFSHPQHHQFRGIDNPCIEGVPFSERIREISFQAQAQLGIDADSAWRYDWRIICFSTIGCPCESEDSDSYNSKQTDKYYPSLHNTFLSKLT